MDTNEEQMSLFEDEVTSQEEPQTNDELKDAIDATLSRIRRQAMLLGMQVCCQTILDTITAFERKPGSKSNNDHKRLIKELRSFCETELSRKVNADGETETAQN